MIKVGKNKMGVFKKINLFSVGLVALFLSYFTLYNLFKWCISGIKRNYFDIAEALYFFLFICISVVIIIYLIYLIKSKTKYRGWVKTSMILNLISVVILIFFFVWTGISYFQCINSFGDKCGLVFYFGSIFGLVISGFFLVLGFLSWIIGNLRNKKNKKK